MNNDYIIQENVLSSHFKDLSERISDKDLPIAINVDYPKWEIPLKCYLLLAYCPDLLSDESSERIFYSKYYWFRYFITIYQSESGQDEGLEQQAFHLLEYSDKKMDWNLIEVIDNGARNDASSFLG